MGDKETTQEEALPADQIDWDLEGLERAFLKLEEEIEKTDFEDSWDPVELDREMDQALDELEKQAWELPVVGQSNNHRGENNE
jgi:inner membrane protein involved in colicin E2 resistance